MSIDASFLGPAASEHPYGEMLGHFRLWAVPAAGDRGSLRGGTYVVQHLSWDPAQDRVTVVVILKTLGAANLDRFPQVPDCRALMPR